MIKTNELRKGNIVNHLGNFILIESVFGDIVNVYAADMGGGAYIDGIDCKDIEPIPITPEWLKRLGFLTMDYEYDMIDWARPDTEKRFSISQNGIPIEKQPFLFEYENGWGDNIEVEVKHVHELQNLYFWLTSEELTIKETV
jgi:hypothetical protein